MVPPELVARLAGRYGFMLSEIIAPMSSHTGPVNRWTRSTALLILSLRSFMSIPHLLTAIFATRRATAGCPHLKNTESHHQIEGAPNSRFWGLEDMNCSAGEYYSSEAGMWHVFASRTCLWRVTGNPSITRFSGNRGPSAGKMQG
jgi:hypothetical protein